MRKLATLNVLFTGLAMLGASLVGCQTVTHQDGSTYRYDAEVANVTGGTIEVALGAVTIGSENKRERTTSGQSVVLAHSQAVTLTCVLLGPPDLQRAMVRVSTVNPSWQTPTIQWFEVVGGWPGHFHIGSDASGWNVTTDTPGVTTAPVPEELGGRTLLGMPGARTP